MYYINTFFLILIHFSYINIFFLILIYKMNYQQKYLKYKKKYLELSGGVAQLPNVKNSGSLSQTELLYFQLDKDDDNILSDKFINDKLTNFLYEILKNKLVDIFYQDSMLVKRIKSFIESAGTNKEYANKLNHIIQHESNLYLKKIKALSMSNIIMKKIMKKIEENKYIHLKTISLLIGLYKYSKASFTEILFKDLFIEPLSDPERGNISKLFKNNKSEDDTFVENIFLKILINYYKDNNISEDTLILNKGKLKTDSEIEKNKSLCKYNNQYCIQNLNLFCNKFYLINGHGISTGERITVPKNFNIITFSIIGNLYPTNISMDLLLVHLLKYRNQEGKLIYNDLLKVISSPKRKIKKFLNLNFNIHPENCTIFDISIDTVQFDSRGDTVDYMGNDIDNIVLAGIYNQNKNYKKLKNKFDRSINYEAMAYSALNFNNDADVKSQQIYQAHFIDALKCIYNNTFEYKSEFTIKDLFADFKGGTFLIPICRPCDEKYTQIQRKVSQETDSFFTTTEYKTDTELIKKEVIIYLKAYINILINFVINFDNVSNLMDWLYNEFKDIHRNYRYILELVVNSLKEIETVILLNKSLLRYEEVINSIQNIIKEYFNPTKLLEYKEEYFNIENVFFKDVIDKLNSIYKTI